MGAVVGIDLGTTKSAIAHLDEHGRAVIIPNNIGESTTPSAVCFKDDKIIVGKEAKSLFFLGEPYTAVSFKRYMGDENFIFSTPGRDYTAAELSGFVLEKLKRDAEAALQQPVTDAVITVPAYFRHPHRQATLQAGKLAGFNVLQLINEPTAAAIAFGARHHDRRQSLLVYDLGGGTFDVTLLRIDGGEILIASSEGDHELGGKDWDERLIEYLATKFKEEFGTYPLEDREISGELYIRVEEAKKILSEMTSTRFSLDYKGNTGTYVLDRELLKNITADLMERTISLCKKVMEGQKVFADSIDGILLVGGSTRMQMVHDFVHDFFRKPPMSGINVEEAVALGAAIVAGERAALPSVRRTQESRIGGLHIVDVTNHSLGMIAINDEYTAYVNSIILPKNTKLPCAVARPFKFRTSAREKNTLEIFMTQGEKKSPEDVYYLGKYVLHDIPHDAGGTSIIDIEYSYNISGTVEVKGKVRASDKLLTVNVEPLPGDIPARFLIAPEKAVGAGFTTVYLALDISGSMLGEPMTQVKEAAMKFLQEIDLNYFAVGLVAFSDSVVEKLKACSGVEKIKGAVTGLQECETGYGTSGHPFSLVRKLFDFKKDERKILIVLTDGQWNESSLDTVIKEAKTCRNKGIEVIAIGFGDADKAFLDKIASSKYQSIFTTQDKLTGVFAHIAQELGKATGGLNTLKSLPK